LEDSSNAFGDDFGYEWYRWGWGKVSPTEESVSNIFHYIKVHAHFGLLVAPSAELCSFVRHGEEMGGV